MIALTFPFEPVAKGRPRMTKQGHCYTPDKTRRFEADVKLWASKYVKEPLSGALSVTACFFLKPPKKPKNYHPIVRPDTDNYLKAVLDALNGIVWHDDSQVVHINATKTYDTLTGAGPRFILLIKEMKGTT